MTAPVPVTTGKPGPLDRLPASVRHLLLALVAAVLSVVANDYTSWHLPAGVAALVGPVLTALLAYVTPLTRQYGVGSDRAA